MKRVTNKTAINIYQRWMTLSAGYYDFVFTTKMEFMNQMTTSEKSTFKLDYVLEDYTDRQIVKIIKGLEDRTQWEAEYLIHILLHLLKSNLRERKLNQIL